MNANLIFQDELKLVALHIVCPFSRMQEEIPKGFTFIKSIMNEIKSGVNLHRIIGFYPQSAESPDPDKCHYYLGVEVSRLDEVPDHLVSLIIPSGRYASYLYKGSLESYIKVAYTKVNNFIKEQGLENILDRFVLELKNVTNDLNDRLKTDNEIELMIPVK